MLDTFSVRDAISNPAVVREVVDHLLARLRSPDAQIRLRGAKSLLILALYQLEFIKATSEN